MRAALRAVLSRRELRGTGVTGLVGVALPATYNTETGAASATRVDGSNQSFVEFAVIPGRQYSIDIAATGGTAWLVRDGAPGPSGPTRLVVDNTRTVTTLTFTNNLVYVVAANAGTTSGTVFSLI
jgi:hypothetical protein